ncbi:hypothetical protein Q9Q94_04050 [Uliginosibacterium sp. 31-16]|uniref:hypothetical protein n=1 Tax=Uliginosibacterium sp. 31-16 TaxID=3068315 RepID=UPI00273DFBA0|nr:hypothetical protein [Uliginosibacterium sp. 31-16]MDP5238685.1 hypothetical protein [Uliginosibacterium sp. 31-16]
MRIPRQRGAAALIILGAILAVVVLLAAAYTWLSLSYDYSDGERAGYVQKFSRKGWVCKTWEGDLALVNLPGQPAEIFTFSVRDDAVATQINALMGKRVTLTYEQHIGVPSSCFGETQYFVTAIRAVE